MAHFCFACNQNAAEDTTGMRLVLVPLMVIALSHTARAQSKRSDAWVLLYGGGDHASMSGSLSELKRVKALRVGKEDLLWARRGNTGFVVRDPQTVARALALFSTMAPVEMKMEGYNRVMNVLSKKMDVLAKRMEAIAGQGGEEPVTAQMEALGTQMERLGREQEKLGAEMERLSKEAEQRLQVLIDECIRTGKAVPAP